MIEAFWHLLKKKTFICLREIIERFARASLLQIYLTADQYIKWSHDCYKYIVYFFFNITGQVPYPTMDINEVKEKVLNGERMPQPQHCSPQL